MQYLKVRPWPAVQVMLLALALNIAACASVVPRSADQGWAAGMALHTSVMETTTIALQRGQISKTDAVRVLEVGNKARQFLDEAQKLKHQDAKGAEASLNLATALLDELTVYLAEMGVK